VTAHHFLAPSVEGDTITLTGQEARHAARALRVRAGETVTVTDGRGSVVEGVVSGEPRSTVAIQVRSRATVPAPVPRVVVHPAVPASGKLELVVQKLTEIGVDRIVPWFAERTVVRWDAAKRSRHGERLRAVAREASKQSKRAWLPDVVDPVDGVEAAGLMLVFHEGAEVPLRTVRLEGSDIGIVIGPEGGLTAEEVERLTAVGGVSVGLGAAILRAETAAIVASALVMARIGRLG